MSRFDSQPELPRQRAGTAMRPADPLTAKVGDVPTEWSRPSSPTDLPSRLKYHNSPIGAINVASGAQAREPATDHGDVSYVGAVYRRFRHLDLLPLRTLARPQNRDDPSGPSDQSSRSDAAMTIAALVVALMDGRLVQWLVDPDKVPTAEEVMTSLRDGIAATGLPITADDPRT